MNHAVKFLTLVTLGVSFTATAGSDKFDDLQKLHDKGDAFGLVEAIKKVVSESKNPEQCQKIVQEIDTKANNSKSFDELKEIVSQGIKTMRDACK